MLCPEKSDCLPFFFKINWLINLSIIVYKETVYKANKYEVAKRKMSLFLIYRVSRDKSAFSLGSIYSSNLYPQLRNCALLRGLLWSDKSNMAFPFSIKLLATRSRAFLSSFFFLVAQCVRLLKNLLVLATRTETTTATTATTVVEYAKGDTICICCGFMAGTVCVCVWISRN